MLVNNVGSSEAVMTVKWIRRWGWVRTLNKELSGWGGREGSRKQTRESPRNWVLSLVIHHVDWWGERRERRWVDTQASLLLFPFIQTQITYSSITPSWTITTSSSGMCLSWTPRQIFCIRVFFHRPHSANLSEYKQTTGRDKQSTIGCTRD